MFNRLALSIALLLVTNVSAGETYTVDEDQSVFAVITQRGGVAARMAHDHLIVAAGYEAAIEVSDGSVSSFSFRSETANLLVDDAALKKRWSKSLTNAGVLRSPFKEISSGDRKTVRKHMLDKDQLDAKRFPQIEARVVSVSERENEFRGMTYSHVAKFEFTVHGKTVARDVSANITVNEDDVAIEAAAAFRFTEFGIKPYSALLGAVKNLDEFFVYCSLQAKREPDDRESESK